MIKGRFVRLACLSIDLLANGQQILFSRSPFPNCLLGLWKYKQAIVQLEEALFGVEAARSIAIVHDERDRERADLLSLIS